jgi:hypothetical protein
MKIVVIGGTGLIGSKTVAMTAMAQEPKVTSLMSKRSSGEPRQGSSDDHSRACAWRVERYPPTQRACVCLRA